MSGERQPLKQTNNYYNEEIYYEDEEPELSPTMKYLLWAVGIFTSIFCIFLFTVYIPSVFIPEARPLEGILKVSEVEHHLTTISAERVRELGLHKFQSIVNDEDDDSTESMEEEDIEDQLDIDLTHTFKSKGVERFILVGDVHGEYNRLMSLMKKVQFNPKKDLVLLLGDFISKGPDSVKVIEWASSNGVECILGNHEYYALGNYAKFHGLYSPFFVNPNDNDTTIVGEKYLNVKGFNDDPEFLMAKKFQPEHIAYINSCPVIRRLGPVPLHKPRNNNGSLNFVEGVAVHAGLRWDLAQAKEPLEEQNPIDCLEMRKLLPPFYNETTDDPHFPNAVGWTGLWKDTQKLLSRKDRQAVYYGHDARKGLRLKKYTRGLDSRCTVGGYLSAMVIWKEEQLFNGKLREFYKEQAYQVKC
ncbi:hypothetical protein CAAN1_01S04258 [[Candida] anglica]|uniref:Calcineurin-like phosphoesterase domain-containing protein n=1 Tax=[Candida] anglica TaxID=148631 RepID=A0ABP0EJV6_9ASCO